jgi:hypothetical protein
VEASRTRRESDGLAENETPKGALRVCVWMRKCPPVPEEELVEREMFEWRGLQMMTR